jgi:hypothetical protein
MRQTQTNLRSDAGIGSGAPSTQLRPIGSRNVDQNISPRPPMQIGFLFQFISQFLALFLSPEDVNVM